MFLETTGKRQITWTLEGSRIIILFHAAHYYPPPLHSYTRQGQDFKSGLSTQARPHAALKPDSCGAKEKYGKIFGLVYNRKLKEKKPKSDTTYKSCWHEISHSSFHGQDNTCPFSQQRDPRTWPISTWILALVWNNRRVFGGTGSRRHTSNVVQIMRCHLKENITL